MFQNGGQKGPKMLDRNWENRLRNHFGDLKRAWWSQGRLYKASSCLFWPPFHRIWTSVSISCSCSGITANVDLQSSSHSSINELCCPQLVYQTPYRESACNPCLVQICATISRLCLACTLRVVHPCTIATRYVWILAWQRAHPTAIAPASTLQYVDAQRVKNKDE